MIDKFGANRREVVATIAGGAVLGALWGAAFPVLATEGRPTIAVIGERNAQVAVIDAGAARFLVLVGEPGESLLRRLPAMLTVFRQRIDVLVGTSPALVSHAHTVARKWRVRHAIVVSDTSDAPSLLMPSTIVADGIDISVGEKVRMELRIGHRDQWRWREPGGMPMWSLRIMRGQSTVSIVPDVRSFAAIPPGPSALLIAPTAPPPELRAISPANALAVNYDSESIDPPPLDGVALARVYPQDIARFVLTDDGVEPPSWTIPAASS